MHKPFTFGKAPNNIMKLFMNKPTFEILKKIINSQGKPLTIVDLMQKYEISSRTFYNYINEINYYLKDSRINGSVLIENDTLITDMDDDAFPYLSSLMNSMSFSEYKLSNEERHSIIILTLLSSNSAVKKQRFEDVLLVSRTSIINDMRSVKNFFSKRNISFKENNHQGLEIECDEKARRKATIDLLISRVFNDLEDSIYPLSPYNSFISSYLKLDKSRIVCEDAIKRCETEMDVELSDQSYYYLITVLSYIVSRLKSGNQMIREMEEARKDKVFVFAERLFSRLEDITAYSYTEVEFLSEMIREYVFQDPSSNSTYMDNSYLQLIVKDLLETLSFYFKTNLAEDGDLLSFLVAHIDSCQRRISNAEEFSNPFLSQVITKYEDHFAVLKKNIYILENSLSISFNDDEIALILMHILASIERRKNSDYAPRIVIACGSGAATSNFLAALIRANFKVNIISVSSLHNALSVIRNDNVDLIISTVPFSVPEVPVVVVDPYLRSEDKRNIQHALNSISMQAVHLDPKDMPAIEDAISVYTEGFTGFQDIINENLIKLNGNARNWKEAIIASGELLLWEKCISVNYLQQMVQLVDKYGPYIVIANGIAFAHASPSQGSLRNGISVVRLDEPIVFGKEEFDPVRIVVGCSILDSPENINILLKIMKIIKDPSFYETVNHAKHKTDILKIFKETNDSHE